MSKPGGCHSSGISLGDALRLPKRHPAWRRREAQSGSCTERENLARAQQAATPMLGVLNGASFNEQFYAPLVAQFRLGLKEFCGQPGECRPLFGECFAGDP